MSQGKQRETEKERKRWFLPEVACCEDIHEPRHEEDEHRQEAHAEPHGVAAEADGGWVGLGQTAEREREW